MRKGRAGAHLAGHIAAGCAPEPTRQNRCQCHNQAHQAGADYRPENQEDHHGQLSPWIESMHGRAGRQVLADGDICA